jgi:hypothetical protein
MLREKHEKEHYYVQIRLTIFKGKLLKMLKRQKKLTI